MGLFLCMSTISGAVHRSLLFLLWIYQPGSTTMPAAASEMMRNIFSGPNIAQGPGKITKSPKYTTKILCWLRNDL